jgi:DNA-binding MarR family transcriptional regulator
MNDPLVLETFLPYRISRLAERVSRSLSQVYSERFGISVPQWRILATLAEAPGLTAQRVAACTNMDKVKVSRAVAELESRGHLRRERSARDGRASDLHLTDEGKAAVSAHCTAGPGLGAAVPELPQRRGAGRIL